MPANPVSAKIKIAQKQLDMTEDAYRAMLFNVAGVRSSTELDAVGAQKVFRHLEALGWKPKPGKKFGKRPNPAQSNAALIRKIEALLAEAKRPWAYADSMAKHMFKVDKVDWCNADQLRRMVGALEIDAKRKQA